MTFGHLRLTRFGYTPPECSKLSRGVDLSESQSGKELLYLANEAGFEVFVTLDRGIEYEQNLARHNIAVIMLRAKSIRLVDLVVHVPEILKVLPSIRVES
jgi:hypothetical protein